MASYSITTNSADAEVAPGYDDGRSNFALVALVATFWLILGVYDTGLAGFIPSKALVRYGLLVVFALCLGGLTRRNPGVACSPLLLLGVWACFAVAVLSSVFGVSLLLGMLKLVLYALVVVPILFSDVPGSVLSGDMRGRRLLLCVAFVFLALGVYRGFFPVTYEFGNTNHVSALALCAFPLFLVDQKSERPLLPRWALSLALATSLLVVIVNHSRGALGGAVVAVVFWISLRNGPSVGRLIGVVVVGVVLFLFVIQASDKISDYLYKGDETVLDDDRTNEVELFKKHFSARPLLGYGFGLSYRVKPEHEKAVLRTGRLSWYVGEFGNSSIAVLIGGGLALFIAVVLLLWSVFSSVWQVLRLEYEAEGRSGDYEMLAALFCGAVGMLVHSQAEGWFMAPVTFAAFSFWFYVSGMIYYVGRYYSRYVEDGEGAGLATLGEN